MNQSIFCYIIGGGYRLGAIDRVSDLDIYLLLQNGEKLFMDNPILTIGITSYKRINELRRCIESIDTQYVDKIEILISEDHSPLSNEIFKMVKELSEHSKYNIRFSSNEINLGYDMNLGAIIQKSKGDYIFFMSDDDMIYSGCIDSIIEHIREGNREGVLYAPFVYSEGGKYDRNHQKNHDIEKGEKNAAKYIYDSILFSGLIFRREYVQQLDSSRFKNMNYFQVYMFLEMLLKKGGYYFKQPSVICVGDGENAYGISESSGGNKILANRKSVKSNLEFNKTLIKVIRMFDKDNNTNIIKNFEKQYSLHSYSGLSIARGEGKKYFNEYYQILKNLDIRLRPIVKLYYVILWIFGKEKADWILSGLRRVVKKEH